MRITLEACVGIDVSKDQLDVAIWGETKCVAVANNKRGIAKLVRQMLSRRPGLVVVEATGGYEEGVVLALFEAGIPVALVSPQRVRQYARAKGLLAGEDRPVRCPDPGGLRQAHGAAAVCGEE